MLDTLSGLPVSRLTRAPPKTPSNSLTILTNSFDIASSNFSSTLTASSSIFFFFSSERLALREKSCVFITIPSTPEGTSKETFLTSSPALPKIAYNNFSSGDSSLLLFGAIFPTRISPCLTCVPMRITPFSSKLLSAFSETFGISLVNSSLPRVVSLISTSNSSLWIDV